MVAGFQVEHEALDGAARALPNQVDALGDTRLTLLSREVPASAFANVDASAEASAVHSRTVQENAQDLEKSAKRLEKIIGDIRGTNGTVQEWDKEKAARQAKEGAAELRLAQARQTDTAAPPATIADRDAANRDRVRAALDGERARLADLQAAQSEYGPRDGRRATGLEAIATANGRIDAYQRLLADTDTKILHFDPAGGGHVVGLTGDLGPDTKSVGVLVPGTNSNITNFGYYNGIARSFADAAPGTSMVTWMDGDFPQGLGAATQTSYAHDLAPRLTGFVNNELQPQLGPDTRVTVIGHSYGGAVVGMADAAGMRADNVVHVASAGMGAGVWAPEHLANSPVEHRYAITAPDDPIQNIQGRHYSPHGNDPDIFPGVIDLTGGHAANGSVLTGVNAHTGVFEPNSESWRNILGVLTGGPVTLTPYQPPAPLLPRR